MDKPPSTDMMPKRDHERDLELDKKIQALRRKNEALMKRYKEVEEDKKRAEEEGMALQSRKGKADDLTITISKSTSDSRVVVTKPFSGGLPAGKGPQEAGPDRGGDGPPQDAGRGHRKQLTVTMAGRKGKRVVSEKSEKRPGPADVKSPTDDGQARRAEPAGRGKQPAHMTKRDAAAAAAAAAQEEIKPGQKHTEEQSGVTEQSQEPESLQAGTDLNVPTSKEEQEEYLRWKKEREQIDRERVARHKNAKGQWRRAWDMDKTENMFSEKSLPDRDWGPSGRGGRSARKGQARAGGDSRGHDKRGKDKGAKNVQVMSSKAKGKDRLTGRARRWQPDDDGENPQILDTTLEEFLEELDALTEDVDGTDTKTKSSPSPDDASTPEEASGSREDTPTQGKAASSEKKVRFSEELVQTAPPPRPTAGSQDSAASDARGPRSAKTPSPKKNKPEARGPQKPPASSEQNDAGPQDKGGGPTAPLDAQTEITEKDSSPPALTDPSPTEKATASPRQSPVQPVELGKCNMSNTNTEELIDSGLSVLSLESGETHPAHPTSSDKAREHGKIV
ncbi:unnamed protein product [Ophioblennius macclurei]